MKNKIAQTLNVVSFTVYLKLLKHTQETQIKVSSTSILNIENKQLISADKR